MTMLGSRLPSNETVAVSSESRSRFGGVVVVGLSGEVCVPVVTAVRVGSGAGAGLSSSVGSRACGFSRMTASRPFELPSELIEMTLWPNVVSGGERRAVVAVWTCGIREAVMMDASALLLVDIEGRCRFGRVRAVVSGGGAGTMRVCG